MPYNVHFGSDGATIIKCALQMSRTASSGYPNMLAKALYDNKAECSDELAFRKGDILTVLDQNIFGSEGWWRCYLHGRQGLAPANRLQLFTMTQNDELLANKQYGSIGRQQSHQNIYQVPSAPKTSGLAMYEQMDSIYITPSSPSSVCGEIYQTPVSSPPQIFYEKAHSSTNQHLLTLPRASRASHPTSPSQAELYDVPPPVHGTPSDSQGSANTSPVGGRSPVFTPTERVQQQIYDIPASPEAPGRSGLKDPKNSNIYDVPPTSHEKEGTDLPLLMGHYNTLPNPRKTNWIYDIPVSPENVKNTCRKISLDRQLVYDVPPVRYGSGSVQSNSEGSYTTSQIYDVPPLQKKMSVVDQTLYDVPASRDILPLHQNGNLKKCSSNIVKKNVEESDSKENVYDIPRGSSGASLSKSEKSSPVCDKRIYDVPPPLPRNSKPSVNHVEQDRLSVSSSESRTSTLSTSSTASNDSFTLSSPESSVQEVTLELDVAIKKITQLQERVSSSIASLMIFVSSKWRLQEHMEANIEEIHRAVDNIISSLGLFIDFSQSIKANASHLTDSNIQLRLNKQLLILTDSLQILTRNQESINLCNWSLQALVIDKPHTTPDDLDRFVMVARTIPDDIKRFVSIIIANGKLLFKKQEEERTPRSSKDQTGVKKPQIPPLKDTHVLQESSSVNKGWARVRERKYQLTRQKKIEDNDYVHLQKKEEFEKMLSLSSNQQLEKKTPEEKRKAWIKPESRVFPNEEPEKKIEVSITKESHVSPPRQDILREGESPKKISLSEHCYLYFGALQKAIMVFNNSLSKNQPPEVFITHGKLIIMVGQKLVDSVCQEVKTNEARNHMLYKSSELCSLLKNLAMATKTAAIQYPNSAAMQELQTRTNELSNYTQLFRAMVE
ncbi:cas scaffolding protein family member 4 [Rhinophrynus dorsalis]